MGTAEGHRLPAHKEKMEAVKKKREAKILESPVVIGCSWTYSC